MDILKILNDSSDSIIKEDLDFFETELATGDYSDEYIAKCKKLIDAKRNWNNDEEDSNTSKTTDDLSELLVPVSDLVLGKNVVTKQIQKKDLIKKDILDIRLLSDYKHKFKYYVSKSKDIDEKFIDENFTFFATWEIDVILTVKQLSEEFLEKYFKVLDKERIAKYQMFSEEYFIRHYADLNVKTVLCYSKNEWCKKEKRSRQLDVFLRLKGVKI